MKTSALFKEKKVLSFEVFPPKRNGSVDSIFAALKELKYMNPDFISVTYGAGGSGSSNTTLEIASAIKNSYKIESVAHLSCLYLSKEEMLVQLDNFRKNGIENILALRGDRNPDLPPKTDFRYANELVSFIKENGDFNVIGACYPEGHPECGNIDRDIENLKRKVDAGADQLITQLFFDNDYFYSFREKAARAGISVPIQAGIMPVTNKAQIERMASVCGVELPKKYVTMMERYEDNPIAMRDAGIAYAIDQIVDLIAQDVDGIHLYTMNTPYIAQKIYEAVNRLLNA